MLWAFDPNAVFEKNKTVLMNLFTKLTELKGQNNRIAFGNLIGMLTDTPAQMRKFDAQLCFTMSKMTIVDDVMNREKKYKSIRFVEFLEYIARAADLKFNQDESDLPEKIEALLDLILPYYGLKRVSQDAVVDAGEKSDVDSVDYDKVDLNDLLFENEDTLENYPIP